MKKLLLALFGATILSSAAMAQSGTNAPVGQDPSGTINVSNFTNNTDATGFSEQSASVLVGAGTTQATAALVLTRIAYVTCATGATGIRLPAVQRYTSISIVNRGTASCIIYPPTGMTLETAAGTMGAANAGYTMATNTDTIWRPLLVAGVVSFYQ